METNISQPTQPEPAVDYPITLSVAYPGRSSRLLALMALLFFLPKALILIPHFVVLYLLGIVTVFAWLFSQVAVLFTARYPKSAFDFMLGVMRWQLRVNGYFMGMTDKYPPFSLNS